MPTMSFKSCWIYQFITRINNRTRTNKKYLNNDEFKNNEYIYQSYVYQMQLHNYQWHRWYEKQIKHVYSMLKAFLTSINKHCYFQDYYLLAETHYTLNRVPHL